MSVCRITSRTNPLIIATASLHEKKYRDKNKLFILEGKKLFSEALASALCIRTGFATEQSLPFCMEQMGFTDESQADSRLICVSESVFEKISTEKSPQGVLCVAEYLDKLHFFSKINNREESNAIASERIVVLSSLRDPGNLGTIIRTARAFGFDRLILSADCADLYNPRTVRSAMGTLFRQKISVVPDLSDAILLLRASGKQVYAAMLDTQAIPLNELAVTRDTVFVVGNEGHGIDPMIASACDCFVLIPMAPDSAESLNAATASAILLWQSFLS
jgi:TrmH family RNA methyltransferase